MINGELNNEIEHKLPIIDATKNHVSCDVDQIINIRPNTIEATLA